MHGGESGPVGPPSLSDLPLRFVLDLGLGGRGRLVRVLDAWVWLFRGLRCVMCGLYSQHFRKNLLPRRSDLGLRPILKPASNHLRFKGPTEEEALSYKLLQRLSYLAVIFVLFPFMFITGFAMSPAITSVLPIFVTIFGGHQSAAHFIFSPPIFLFCSSSFTWAWLSWRVSPNGAAPCAGVGRCFPSLSPPSRDRPR